MDADAATTSEALPAVPVACTGVPFCKVPPDTFFTLAYIVDL
jgi:hypothetical protein